MSVPVTGAKFQAYIDMYAPSSNVLISIAPLSSPLNFESTSVNTVCDKPYRSIIVKIALANSAAFSSLIGSIAANPVM
eukprot:5347110-Ditylum_brightwellii.AAC.1